ncbi:ANTAR domain-containing protein [Nocardia noduli]|uniref:ANTAR domain-containing protein n=1 Tax=Nocardia noduli TaxID=2815722 RepID=UPI001C23B0AA|nr:ANTAR domain-containing protein [Nocardia noduli]
MDRETGQKPEPVVGEDQRERPSPDTPGAVGSFRFWFDDHRWEWSEEIWHLYGYEPGEMTPTTELLLAHNHPDDRAAVADALAAAVRDHGAFGSHHRVIDTAGVHHQVMVVGDGMFDATGTVVGTQGYFIDLTASIATYGREALDEVLPDLVTSRADIEQAKGILILAYGLSPEQAFATLRWRSQETNVKLRTLARRLVAAARALRGGPPRQRLQMDHILLSLHEYLDPPDDQT